MLYFTIILLVQNNICITRQLLLAPPPSQNPAHSERAEPLHVQVLLGLLDVPLDLAVDVKVELFGHRQRNQRRPLWVGILAKTQKCFLVLFYDLHGCKGHVTYGV